MNAEITGTVLVKNQEQTFGEKGFRVRTFVVTTEEQYSQEVEIKLTQDKCDLIDAYEVGSQIKVHVNLKSRTWVDPKGVKKYFSSFEGWRVEKAESVGAEATMEQTAVATPDSQDLPF